MRSILLLMAHPAFERSRAGRALTEAVATLPGVTLHDLYEAYPDLLIDVAHEQKLLARHDILVFQHPFYWYSAPALLKDWFDIVLTYGFAYGVGGTAIAGKPWLTAITAGGQPGAYRPGGLNRFSIAELLRPIEATAHLCGCVWQEPFVLYGSHAIDEAGLEREGAAFRNRLEALQFPTLEAISNA